MSKPAIFSLLVSAMAFALAAVSGCGPKVAKDPLASVGGYKLVYQQQEKRRVEPDLIASALRKRINAKNAGEVVVNALDDGGCEILLPGASERTVADVKRAIALGNLLKFRIVALKDLDDERIAAAADGEDAEGAVWAAYNPENVTVPPTAAVRTTPAGKSLVLVLEGDQPVDAWHIQHAEVSTDESSRPCVLGSLNEEGARRMEKLTSTNRHRQLAIILDGVVITAPVIQSTLSSVVQVSGNFSENEVKFIVESLRSAHALGSLEPEPSSEVKVVGGSEK